MNDRPLGIYIHIPFCKRKCAYCDFLSFCARDGQEEAVQAYVDALCAEIGAWGACEPFRGADRLKAASAYIVDSVFIGGGTPSLLGPDQIGRILDTLRSCFVIAPDAEISMESNPGAFYEQADESGLSGAFGSETPGGSSGPPDSRENTAAALAGYRKAGVNRLSIGAQSFQADMLRFLGRIHTKQQFIETYEAARHAGYDNINIDMMFGVPGMRLAAWEEDLRELAGLQPEHVSFYSLQLEEGTPLCKDLEEGRFRETDPDEDRRMYDTALVILESAGYRQYEISNAAKPGRACRHNLKYWSMDEYLGFGLGAHSYLRPDLRPGGSYSTGIRFSNQTDLQAYMKAAAQLGRKQTGQRTEFASSPFIMQRHENTMQDEMSEYIFTGLRKTPGIRTEDFRRRFDADIESLYAKQIDTLQKRGLLEKEGPYLRLTRQGIDISNQVFIEFV